LPDPYVWMSEEAETGACDLPEPAPAKETEVGKRAHARQYPGEDRLLRVGECLKQQREDEGLEPSAADERANADDALEEIAPEPPVTVVEKGEHVGEKDVVGRLPAEKEAKRRDVGEHGPLDEWRWVRQECRQLGLEERLKLVPGLVVRDLAV
jgi:hypothetical protein